FGRVKDTHLDHIAVLTSGGVVTEGAGTGFHFIHHHRAFRAGVGSDLTDRSFHGAQGQGNTDVLIFVVANHFHLSQGAHQSHTTASNHAFFYCGTGCVQSVIHAVFLLFHFYFGTGTDFDNGNTAGQFVHAFLQFFFVVVRGRSGDFGTDLVDAGFLTISRTGTVTHHGVFVAVQLGLVMTQYVHPRGFQCHTDFFNDPATT